MRLALVVRTLGRAGGTERFVHGLAGHLAAAGHEVTAFCAAATVENATRATAVGYRVMGHPGVAPRGYRDFSFRRRLNRGVTRKGNLS